MSVCQKCRSNNPKFFFRCYIGEKSFEVFLCEECMTKMGAAPLGLIGDELIFEHKSGGMLTPEQLKSISDIECTNCGTTHQDVSIDGWFGCEECYTVFGDLLNVADAQIENSLNDRKHLQDTYSGTVFDAKLETIKRQMERAIESENYERAAELRDEIEEMKENRNGENAPTRKN